MSEHFSRFDRFTNWAHSITGPYTQTSRLVSEPIVSNVTRVSLIYSSLLHLRYANFKRINDLPRRYRRKARRSQVIKRKLDSENDQLIFWLDSSSRHNSPEVTLSEDKSESQSNDQRASLRRGTCIF